VTGNRFADAAKKMPTCVGMGLFPEAIIQNPVFYDCVYDMIWRDQPADVDAWVKAYAQRRYGATSAKVDEAWQLLLNQGPYVKGTSGVESSSMIAARPALVVKKSGPNAGFQVPYPPLKLVEATELLLQESEKLGQADTYRYDLVDFTRQILSNLTQIVQKDIRTAYQNKDKAAYDKAVAEFDGILADVDRLLASRTEFLYGKWLANASRWGTTPEEKAQYAWNAAMLVTIWGPSDETDGKKVQIFDYSWREWSGLINNFYRPRWQQFHGFLAQSIDKGDYIDPTQQVYGREAFRSSPFYSKLADWEMAFIKQPLDLPATPQGDSVAIVRELLTKYHDRLIAAYPADQAVPAKPAVKIPGKVIGGWKANEITPAGKELMLDITKQVQDEGEYEITFTYTGGSKRLDIKSVALYVNGNEVMRDTHPGATGNEHIRNTYTVKVAELVFNGKYEIRAQVRTDGGDSSIGTISMQKKGSRQ
jgi:alpha-N-acetylglucosaminidase